MNYHDETLLEMVELYAMEMGYISDEQELSDKFDDDVAPSVVAQYGKDDEPAMNEAFNDWTDSLCKDGEIHPIQYHEYCYIGVYS